MARKDFNMKVVGVEETERTFKEIEGALFDGMVEAIRALNKELLQESRKRAPIKTGALINSARSYITPSKSSGEIDSGVYYNTGYAWKQHEGWYSPGRRTAEKLGDKYGIGRKYLQNPFKEMEKKYFREARKIIKKVEAKYRVPEGGPQ